MYIYMYIGVCVCVHIYIYIHTLGEEVINDSWCVGCENPHTISCSRIHQTVWHPKHTFYAHIIIVMPIFVIQVCRV